MSRSTRSRSDLVVTDSGGRDQADSGLLNRGQGMAGGYAPVGTGRHVVSSRCTDAEDSGLHGCGIELQVADWQQA